MSARKEPTRWSPPPASGEGATLAWLDALANGACSSEAFLDAMHHHFQQDRDEAWEVMSLFDQYYRRGKIPAEIFHTLKSRLEGSALAGEKDVAAKMAAPAAAPPRASGPPPESRMVTTPTVASQKRPSPASHAAAREVAVGEVLRGRYRVRGLLGHGGMGTVFEAVDEYRLDLPTTNQRIALKVLHTAAAHGEELSTELQREFQHLQLLSHPNIVRVHEFDRDGEIAFFTMELLHGALLSSVLRARHPTALLRPYALAIMRDVGAALAYAHSRGVVHGDVNPQNIFITNDGELRVLDFGASHPSLLPSLTADDALPQHTPVATPGFASCQLLEGDRPDARDDVFAFACVAYVLLSGRHPFPNRSAAEARAQSLRPRRPKRLTDRQWRVLRQGLRWERERRPSDIRQWLLKFGLAGAAPRLPSLPVLVTILPSRKRTAVLASTGILLFVLLALGGYWALTEHESLDRRVTEWSRQLRSALDANPVSPVAPVPAGAPPSALPTQAPAITRAAATPPHPANTPAAARVAQLSIREASAHIGNAGPARVEMAADTVDVQATETTAHVTVHRKGNLYGDTQFTWWTESGTAKSGRDFVAVTPRVEKIGNGASSLSLSIPVSAAQRTRPKSFYVVIDRTETGAALGARTLTMVTLQPPE